MKLIADSGSTKTDWCLLAIEESGCPERSDNSVLSPAIVHTQGINPYHQSESAILGILRDELLPQIADAVSCISSIHLYGAGCSATMSPRVQTQLEAVFPQATTIEVGSDMLGAARAVCGNQSGIACILGTGMNTCLYDGHDITAGIPPLGYILGDEGSAAYIGKRLVGDVLKDQLPPDICQLFLDETALDMLSVVDKVYRQPLANRFLGSLARFASRHRDHAAIHALLLDCFTEFFTRNILGYKRPELPVNFVGSIAEVFQPEIAEAAQSLHIEIGNVLRSPIEGLANFHETSLRLPV